MKIATWNVNGIRARADQFCEWIGREQPDVVCLQELKAQPDQIPVDCQPPDYHAYWHGMKGYSGVSLHIHRDLAPEEIAFDHPSFDLEARFVEAVVGDMIVASVYVPNGGKDYPAKLQFLKQLKEWVRRHHEDGHEVVLCGDMNVTRTDLDVHPKERKPNAICQRPEERALFAELLGEQLVDLGRAFDPDNPGLFTWWAHWRNHRARNIGWRLDYILASHGVAERATDCVVQSDVGTSDHAPVVVTMD